MTKTVYKINITCIQNDLTGEHSCIMLKMLTEAEDDVVDDEENEESEKKDLWLDAYWEGNVCCYL